MKRKCEIADTSELAKIVSGRIAAELDKGITYRSDLCELADDGAFRFVYRDESGTYGARRTFTASEIASMRGVLNWEVVTVPNGDAEENAILFYE